MYEVVEYCTVPDCRCVDWQGVILYRGPDADEAKEAEGRARYEYVEVTYHPTGDEA